MFYAEQDKPSQLWYIYNSNRKDGGAFGSYRDKEEALNKVRLMNRNYIWEGEQGRLINVPRT